MSVNIPLFWQPAIGFAMNRMGHGDSGEVIIERMGRLPQYANLSLTDRENIISIASGNMTASRRANSQAGDIPLFSAYGAGATHIDTIGARVICHITDDSGVSRSISVLVNVSNQATKDDVLQFVHDQIMEPGGSLFGKWAYGVSILSTDCEVFLQAGPHDTGLTYE